MNSLEHLEALKEILEPIYSQRTWNVSGVYVWYRITCGAFIIEQARPWSSLTFHWEPKDFFHPGLINSMARHLAGIVRRDEQHLLAAFGGEYGIIVINVHALIFGFRDGAIVAHTKNWDHDLKRERYGAYTHSKDGTYEAMFPLPKRLWDEFKSRKEN